MDRVVIGAALVLVLLGVGIFVFDNFSNGEIAETLKVEGNEVKVLDNGERYIVDPDELLAGGPPKDGIPSIDNPKFVSVSEADGWIEDNALVLALEYNGIKRVYPFQIMTWHEIVNDNFNGEPVLVTYCPLCGSGIAFERTIEIDGKREEVEFGTSGKLYNSNLVMYDRKTDSYWTQIGGKAIIGELSGQELREIDIDTVEWGEWKAVHGDSEVLSLDTGYQRDYTNADGPYANYFADDFYLFPGVENRDSGRLANKEFVFGIEIDGVFKAYAKKDVERLGNIEDEVGGVSVLVEKQEDGSVEITRLDTGEIVAKEVDFWFAWFTFHPETELYGFD